MLLQNFLASVLILLWLGRLLGVVNVQFLSVIASRNEVINQFQSAFFPASMKIFVKWRAR